MLLSDSLGKFACGAQLFPCKELIPFKYSYLKLSLVNTVVKNDKASQNNTLKVNKLVFVLLLTHSKRVSLATVPTLFRLFSKLAECNGALHAIPS
jgi:hypothetical protein